MATLVDRRGLLAGGWSAAVASLAPLTSLAVGRPLFTDFSDYWAAARILGTGGDPYDQALVAAVLRAAGVHSTVGTGYSYQLLLAEAMRRRSRCCCVPASWRRPRTRSGTSRRS